MRFKNLSATLAALSISTAATAQGAGSAFECNQPYRDTMEAMGDLTVLTETQEPAFGVFIGATTRIEFAPGPTRIYGQTPTKLALTMREPTEHLTRQFYTVTFHSEFSHTEPVQDALTASNKWHLNACGPGIPMCLRSKADEESGELHYRRDDNGKTTLACTFEIPVDELPE